MKSKAGMNLSTVSGFSLVEVLIATGIMSVTALVFSTMIVNQNNQVTNLENKMARADLQNLMLQTVANPSVCSWQLLNQTVDTTGVTTTNPSSSVVQWKSNTLYAGSNASTAAVIVRVNDHLGGKESSPTVTDIVVRNIRKVNAADDDHYIGELNVEFSQTKSMSLRPATMAIAISTDPDATGSVKQIKSCAAASTTGSSSAAEGELCGLWKSNYSYVASGGSASDPGGPLSATSSCHGENISVDEDGRITGCPAGYMGRLIFQFRDEGRPNGGHSGTYTFKVNKTYTCVKQ